MVKLTAELIEQAAQYTNAVRDRELDLRGESGGGRRSGLPARLVAWPGPAACARTAGAWPAACVQRPLPDWILLSAAEGPPWAFRGALSPAPPCTPGPPRWSGHTAGVFRAAGRSEPLRGSG